MTKFVHMMGDQSSRRKFAILRGQQVLSQLFQLAIVMITLIENVQRRLGITMMGLVYHIIIDQ